METIGIIGAGEVGSQIARAAVGQGYKVVIANSRGPETLGDLVSELGPPARPGRDRSRGGRKRGFRGDSRSAQAKERHAG